jgi:hypothetical protein
MAVVKKKVLGELRGKIGSTVYRVRNGKNYAASVPSEYNASQSPLEVDKRNKFRINGKFAKAIKESELLYSIWDKEKAPATNAYNKICKVNFSHCGTNRPSEKNVITPEGEFILPVRNITSLPEGIEVMLESSDIPELEKQVIYIMIISLYEPAANGHNYFELLVMEGCETEENTLKFNFDENEIQLAKEYKNKTIFLASVTEDEDGKILSWSKTYAEDL